MDVERAGILVFRAADSRIIIISGGEQNAAITLLRVDVQLIPLGQSDALGTFQGLAIEDDDVHLAADCHHRHCDILIHDIPSLVKSYVASARVQVFKATGHLYFLLTHTGRDGTRLAIEIIDCSGRIGNSAVIQKPDIGIVGSRDEELARLLAVLIVYGNWAVDGRIHANARTFLERAGNREAGVADQHDVRRGIVAEVGFAFQLENASIEIDGSGIAR